MLVMVGQTETMTWSSILYTTSISFTDPCGAKIAELYDYTSSVEDPLNGINFVELGSG